MNSLNRIFKDIQVFPEPVLEERILRVLSQEQERLVRKRTRLAVSGVALSIVLFLGTTLFLGTALIQSEFWSLFKLIFSDMGALMTSSGDFLYSLLETLPIVPLIAFFIPSTIFFFSMSFWLSLDERGVTGKFRVAHV